MGNWALFDPLPFHNSQVVVINSTDMTIDIQMAPE